ncbi:hypothetical protein [Streptomyces tanashiensis]|uniref:Uncharacterized protein n=1 Tax=Streptomyces tanashiensis TaxID=67367 RepID=A0ABY6R6U7_9ACTN|nr:hypothetical protein [Streptomyces tanashiensis]UZX25798.1 hypothetical protein LDH80_36145 [Streptomyces tanashiensis]GGY10013.1 hypothetical protein GCM10010299_12210 [Streptomyces tanashiensis]
MRSAEAVPSARTGAREAEVDVEPTSIVEAERRATRDFPAGHPAAALPCDDRGNRVA